MWYSQLNQQVQKFTQQASELAEWEMQLFTNGHKLFNLYENAQKVEESQSELDEGLDRIGTQQNEIHTMLTELEKKVEALFSSPDYNGRLRPAEEQREQAYHHAENINAQLNTMDDTLSSLVNTLNSQRGAEEQDELAEITDVLNLHLESLQQINMKSNLLETRISETEQLLNQQKREQAKFRR